MTLPLQADLFAARASAEKVRKRVRETSIAQYADGRERFEGRKAEGLRLLAAFINRKQSNPTAAELLHFDGVTPHHGDWYERLVNLRRALSDLQDAGVVESVPVPKEMKKFRVPCAVTRKRVERWRVVPVGRTKVSF